MGPKEKLQKKKKNFDKFEVLQTPMNVRNGKQQQKLRKKLRKETWKETKKDTKI